MDEGNFFDGWHDLPEVGNPEEFITGCIVEITSKRADRIVVRRYYENTERWMKKFLNILWNTKEIERTSANF